MSACSKCGYRHNGPCAGSPEETNEKLSESSAALESLAETLTPSESINAAYLRGRSDGYQAAIGAVLLFAAELELEQAKGEDRGDRGVQAALSVGLETLMAVVEVMRAVKS